MLQVEAVAVFADLFMPNFQEYSVVLRCVSGGSHKRNTQMVQILRLAAGNRIVLSFLQSASLRLK